MTAFIPIEFQKVFDKTRQPAIAVHATYNPNPHVMASRFGGLPYWQADTALPCEANGSELALLAQINFAELPPHPDLPDHGIVQFFIPRHDDYYGADLYNQGSRGKMQVHFWQHPDAKKHHSTATAADDDSLLPVFAAHTLTFFPKFDCAGIDTIECAEALNANPFEVLEDISLNRAEENAFYDAIVDHTASHGHKLLGYPYFTQDEPRQTGNYRLLLQIDTDMDGDNDIMWADNGVGHLFIRQQDLQNQNFDKVWFSWDCC